MKWRGGGGPCAPFISFSASWIQEHYVKFTHILKRFTQIYTILYISMCRQRARMKWNARGGEVHVPPLFHFGFLNSGTLYEIHTYLRSLHKFIQFCTYLYVDRESEWNEMEEGRRSMGPLHFVFNFLISRTLFEIHTYLRNLQKLIQFCTYLCVDREREWNEMEGGGRSMCPLYLIFSFLN